MRLYTLPLVYIEVESTVQWLLEREDGSFLIQVMGKDEKGEVIEHTVAINCNSRLVFNSSE